MQTSRPEPSSVATATKGNARSSIRRPPSSRVSRRRRRAPPMSAEPPSERSIIAKTRRRFSPRAKPSNAPSRPAAWHAPTTAPMDVPATTSMATPCAASSRDDADMRPAQRGASAEREADAAPRRPRSRMERDGEGLARPDREAGRIGGRLRHDLGCSEQAPLPGAAVSRHPAPARPRGRPIAAGDRSRTDVRCGRPHRRRRERPA